MNARIVLNYANIGDAVFASKALGMVNQLTDNPNFPLPWPEEYPGLAAMKEKQEKFANALTAAADLDKGKVAAKNSARLELENVVRENGRYIQTKSRGDRAILEGTGYDLAKTRERTPDIPDAPSELRLKHGLMPGSVIATAKPPRGAKAFELQYCIGNPTTAEWITCALMGQCRKIEATGLERGKDHTFRLRAIGRKGPGSWSDIEQIMPV